MDDTTRKNQLKAQGALILSELNDLKRTVESCAKEIKWDEAVIQSIVDGNSEVETVNKFIETCSEYYPINKSQLFLLENDCDKGIKIYSLEESKKSSRIFQRSNRHGAKSPYYEYRDTVMSKLSYFRPEWIKQLRFVSDNDPNNPDVIYNNGHFMHQVTFFVGPVNFYYEIDGIKYCEEMNTGDSNYITPFYPHSFTTRDQSQEAYIIAVTFGANVKRSLKEIYNLGLERMKQYVLKLENKHKATQSLVDYHLANCRMNREILANLLSEKGYSIDVHDTNKELSELELKGIAEILKVDVLDLIPFMAKSSEKVHVQKEVETQAFSYPSKKEPHYAIKALASVVEMPLVKSSKIKVLSTSKEFSADFKTGLHSYVFNYGSSPCIFSWKYQEQLYHKTLNPGDSLYIQPFIEHQFRKQDEDSPKLYCVGIPAEITLETQKELSRLKDIQRAVFESKCWFN